MDTLYAYCTKYCKAGLVSNTSESLGGRLVGYAALLIGSARELRAGAGASPKIGRIEI
jgi:hypothetical protein